MSVYINDKYRVKRNSEHELLMRKLIDSDVFTSYANILSISAIFGYRNKLFMQIEKPASDGVLMQFFTEEEKDLIDLISYAHSRNQNILKTDEKYEIFESYANGGFPILVHKLEISNNELAFDQKALLLQLYQVILSDDVEMITDSSLEDMIL